MKAKIVAALLTGVLFVGSNLVARAEGPVSAGRDLAERSGGQPHRSMHKQGRPGGERGGADLLTRVITSPQLSAELGLKKEQIETLKNEILAQQKRMIDLKAELEKSALEQAKLLSDSALDEAALMSAIEETGRIRTELAKMKVRSLVMMRQTLTTEQLEKARALIREKMRQRFTGELREMSKRRRERGQMQWDGGKRRRGDGEDQPGRRGDAPPPPNEEGEHEE